MRLFVAINFDPSTRAALLALRDELRAVSERGHFSLPENLHLTLVFLGEREQPAAAKTAMDAVNFAPFDMRIEGIGRFRRDHGDIWWAGVHGGKPLAGLHDELTRQLTAAGFALEKRKYTPHVTLGREVVTSAVPWQIKPFGEVVNQIDLMSSARINGKLTYTAIHTKKALT